MNAGDIECDLRVFMRVDDPEALWAKQYWRYALRLWCYDGAVAKAMKVWVQQRERNAEGSAPQPGSTQVDARHLNAVLGESVVDWKEA